MKCINDIVEEYVFYLLIYLRVEKIKRGLGIWNRDIYRWKKGFLNSINGIKGVKILSWKVYY